MPFIKGYIPSTKGKPRSLEVKRKISLANKGKKRTNETKEKLSKSHKGQIAWNKGIPHTKETKEKISNSNKGNTNWLGKNRSIKTKEKISITVKNLWKEKEYRKKTIGNHLGYKLTNEHKNKIRKATIKNGNKPPIKKGSENHLWKGGITPINHQIRTSSKYKEWRLRVFQRDNYTCQKCKKRGVILHADHIKPFAYYPELRLDINNGRTLCVECHKQTDTYAGKGRWLKL